MNWDGLAMSVLVGCAVITTGVVVHNYLVSPSAPQVTAAGQPTIVDDWPAALNSATVIGPASARVKLLEFGDYECPYCASLHSVVQSLRERHPAEVALYYVHYPLPMHRSAESAARAAECANDQGRFETMHDVLFEQQSAIGNKSWKDFAIDAGVPDLDVFASCIQSQEPIKRVVDGRLLGEKLNIDGTPTVAVNGWKLGRPPTAEELERMVQAALAGKSLRSLVSGEARD